MKNKQTRREFGATALATLVSLESCPGASGTNCCALCPCPSPPCSFEVKMPDQLNEQQKAVLRQVLPAF